MNRKAFLILGLCLGLVMQPVQGASQPVTLDIFQTVLNEVEQGYYKPVSRDALLQAALEGMLSSLDPYSQYFNASEYKSFTDAVTGSYVGIGIVVKEHPQYIEVGMVYPKSPASGADIRKGDVITAVNGQSLAGFAFEERIDKLLGPENTAVSVAITRGNETITKSMVRKKIEVSPISHSVVRDNIGYIRIAEFTSTSLHFFEDAVSDLKKQAVKGIVIDIRDNPGGDVEAVLSMAEMLVPSGKTLMTVKYRSGQETYVSEGKALGLPLVLLVNENSASASEILAGIVKDNKAGTVVGTKTYGKGVAQSLNTIKGGAAGGYKFTIYEFFTSSMKPIQGVGVVPDVLSVQPTGLPDEKTKNLAAITDEGPIKIGAAGLNVMAVEQRLYAMGYNLTIDGIYDKQTADLLKQLGVDSDGRLIKSEAEAVHNLFLQASQKSKEDVQLSKAIEILSK